MEFHLVLQINIRYSYKSDMEIDGTYPIQSI